MNVLKINAKKLDMEIIEKISDCLKNGKIIICPTDTIYGLICDATDKKAVLRIFKIKKRPKGKPIAIFAKNIKMAKKFAKISKTKGIFLKNNKITGIFEVKKQAKKLLVKGIVSQGKIGIRIPKYRLINKLFENINFPIAQTSANISGKPGSVKIKVVLNQFKNQKNQPDLVFDAGNLKPAKPSRVIDLTVLKPKILRL